jgi:site-specific DNA-cytosine methylase
MPIEYERLQNFPDDYTEYGIGMKGDKSVIGFHFENQVINDDGETGEVLVEEFAKAKQDGEVIKISDTARYQVLGNAVTVSVVAYVIGKLFKGGDQ